MSQPIVELKPCPFCGARAELFQNGSRWAVECSAESPTECPCKPWTHYMDTPESAIEAWNKRADVHAIQPACGWIPVDEIFPEPAKYVYADQEECVLVCTRCGEISVGYCRRDYELGVAFYDYKTKIDDFDGKVVAWMPLPEPYEEEK